MAIHKKKIKTGLFFGSFNPIHIGHLIVAAFMREFSDLDKVWFVISPHNPVKEKKTLLTDHHRLMLVKTAIEGDPKFKACDIEFKMPQPSYTIDTLTYLHEKFQDHEFVLIAGTDILHSFHKWKNYQNLLNNYHIYIYDRPGYKKGDFTDHPSVKFFEAPLMEISSSFIRQAISKRKDVQYMLPPKVWKYMREMHFYDSQDISVGESANLQFKTDTWR